MIDSFELKYKLFLAEGLGLNLHTEAKTPRPRKTNINADFTTSILEGVPRICLSKPWIYFIYVGYLDHE